MKFDTPIVSAGEATPPPTPPRSGEGGRSLLLPLSASGRGLGGRVSSPDDDPILADLIDELTARLHAGREVDAEALVREHPAQADQLRLLLPALQALAHAGRGDRTPGLSSPTTDQEVCPHVPPQL